MDTDSSHLPASHSKEAKPVSLRRKVIGPQIIFLVIQLTILMFCFLGLGILNNAREDEVAKLSASVGSRAIQIQKFFNNISINASYAAEKIQADFGRLCTSSGLQANDYIKSKDGVEKFLSAAMPDLISSLEYSGTSGAFIILDQADASGQKPALYLRDTQPSTVNTKDMLLLRGPYQIARQYAIPLDSEWSYEQPFSGSAGDEYYIRPMEAAQKNQTRKADQTGYWNGLFHIPPASQNSLTYTIPLEDNSGRPFGVFGFEVNETLIVKNLPADEIPYADALYVLFRETDPSGIPQNAAFSGAYASLFKASEAKIQPAGFGNAAVLSIESGGSAMLGIKTRLELYSPASSFAADKWSLIGMAPQEKLLSVWYTTLEVLIISFFLALIIGLIGIFRSGSVFTRPVSALANRIRAANPKEPLLLGRTSIAEIDDLTAALETMSGDVAEAASRLSKIIGLVGLPLGGYEADFHSETVYCTDSMFALFELEKPLSNTVPIAQWQSLLADILNDKEEGFEDVYRYNPTLKSVRWLRIKKIAISAVKEIGIVMDVSDEVIHQRQSEFERDYDLLTGFMNKKAFLAKCAETIDSNPDANGILLLTDLYFIHRFEPLGELENDSIMQAARRFGLFRSFGAVISRISNYEFAAYIHPCESPESVLDFCRQNFLEPLLLRRMDGQTYNFFFSIGNSLYPNDARKIEDLVTLADFAQSTVKQLPQKGLLSFNAESYSLSGSLAQKQFAMEAVLATDRLGVRCVPVVDSVSGEIAGYDTLIDYRNDVIRKAEDMMALARIHKRLFDLEKLSLVSVLSFIEHNLDALQGKKIFFSSITNEILPQKEICAMDAVFGKLYPKIVFSLADSEHTDKQVFLHKNAELRKRGIAIAIDHYGTMEAGELLILDLKPSFLRFDPSITQDVHLDANRHQLLQALLSYTATRGIKTIATEIRTKDELDTLVKMGIDYVSGSYLSGSVSGPVLTDSAAAQEIRQKVLSTAVYKFVLENGDERFAYLLGQLPPAIQLTDREKAILLQICYGELNNVIAGDLGISANTLKTHIRNIYGKFNVRNRKELLMIAETSGSPDSELTLREKEILKLIVQGKSNQEITQTLCISNNTIRVHIWNICTKLGVKNRKDLLDLY